MIDNRRFLQRKSAQFRARAAAALRESREPGRPERERRQDHLIAEAYKGLAENLKYLERQNGNDPR